MGVVILDVVVVWLIKDTVWVMVAIGVLVPYSPSLAHAWIWVYSTEATHSVLHALLVLILTCDQQYSLVETTNDWDFRWLLLLSSSLLFVVGSTSGLLLLWILLWSVHLPILLLRVRCLYRWSHVLIILVRCVWSSILILGRSHPILLFLLLYLLILLWSWIFAVRTGNKVLCSIIWTSSFLEKYLSVRPLRILSLIYHLLLLSVNVYIAVLSCGGHAWIQRHLLRLYLLA